LSFSESQCDLFLCLPQISAGSDSKVIKALAEAFPECKTVVDRRGRTPLHFALGDKPATPDVVLLLSNSGAAGYADDNGMVR
jgi:ankyrin repeat protein